MVLALTTTAWWTLGFVLGAVVVLFAATLLLVVIALARRIARQAAEITGALDGVRANTHALFEVGRVNHTLESLTRALKAQHGEQHIQDERGLLRRATGRLLGGGESSA